MNDKGSIYTAISHNELLGEEVYRWLAECKKVAPVIFADAGPDCENCREVVKC